eukprot:TRINITY_DN8454_c1_g1_i4.p1 TRINITY_DN8454_c1_g1~~TRINITY_DN8454_c1_g1_i4.p1  ORF type:complete len:1525 (+),score=272.84 TRINITY_DN8454_c1_g1_i4:1596-6170(+)
MRGLHPWYYLINLSSVLYQLSNAAHLYQRDQPAQLQKQLWMYRHDANYWSLASQIQGPELQLTAHAIYNNNWVFIGAQKATDSASKIWFLSLEEFLWKDMGAVSPARCLACVSTNTCVFDRSSASFGKVHNKLYVYGGIKGGIVHRSMFSLDLELLKVDFYHDYSENLFEMRQPAPKFDAATTVVGDHLLLFGGSAALSGCIGDDLWIWNGVSRLWMLGANDVSPVYRRNAAVAALNENEFVLFGGRTCRAQEFLLNDLWLYSRDSQAWSVLSRPTDTEGHPYAREGAAIVSWNGGAYLIGGKTASDSLESQLWRFDRESNKWMTMTTYNDVSMTQHLYEREGISFTLSNSTVWAWGGQVSLPFAAREDYSTVFRLHLSSLVLEGIRTALTPPRLLYATMTVRSDLLYIFGGAKANGDPSSEFFRFNTTEFSWSKVPLRISPFQSRPFISRMRDSMIFLHSSSLKQQQMSVFHLDTYDWRDLLLEGVFSQQEGISFISMENTVFVFGGQDGFKMESSVFRYTPGICSFPEARNLTGKFETQKDTLPAYFLNNFGTRSCSWLLSRGTSLYIDYNLGASDELEIVELLESGEQEQRALYSGASSLLLTDDKSQIVNLRRGSVYTANKINLVEFSYAACGNHGFFHQSSRKCSCLQGYIFNATLLDCIPCSVGLQGCDSQAEMQENEIGGNLNLGLVIGLAVGLGSLAALIGILLSVRSRKKVSEIQDKYRRVQLIVPVTELEFGEAIGAGSFGEVYRGIWRGADVAIKKFYNQLLGADVVEEFSQEIGIMVQLRHPNILLYMGACVEEPNYAIISEYMSRGTIYEEIHREPDISMEMKMKFFRDTLKGMIYLHSSNPPIIHRDLKSTNLLLDENWGVKISDFGLSTMKKVDGRNWGGSLAWLAPEVILQQTYSEKSDVYAFAVIMWEILTQGYPYEELDSSHEIVSFVCQQQKRMKLPQLCTKEIRDAVENAWAQNPDHRPSFATLYEGLKINFTDNRVSTASKLSLSDTPAILVAIQVDCISDLWDKCPEATSAAIIIIQDNITKLLGNADGRRIFGVGDSQVLAFMSPLQATNFCLRLHEELERASWPKLIEEVMANSATKKAYIGLGLQTAITLSNQPIGYFFRPDLKRSLDKNIRACISLSLMAHGGQILIEDHVVQLLSEQKAALGFPIITKTNRLNEEGTIVVYDQIVAKQLASRLEIFKELDNQVCEAGNPQISSVTPVDITQSERTSLQAISKTSQEKRTSSSGSPTSNVAHHQKVRWEVDPAEVYDLKKRIGFGTFGSVHLASYKGKTVAVKHMLQQSQGVEYYAAFMQEISILMKLNHPNLIKFIGACTQPPNMSILTEYVEGGNLYSLLRQGNDMLNQKQKLKVAHGIASAMNYLHKLRPLILHRDLKSTNVLIQIDYVPVVCDFGFARTKAFNNIMTKCGTMTHEAPEILLGLPYDEKADVYSFAIVLWEMLTGKIPFLGFSPSDVVSAVTRGRRLEIPKDADPFLASLAQRCWRPDPSDRPSFEEIASLPELS